MSEFFRCEGDDIVDDGGVGEQRYRDMIEARKLKLLRAKRRGRFYNHMPAVDIRAALGQDVWNEYFKFSIERHPYEKVVSHIFFHARDRKDWDFDRELEPSGYDIIQPVVVNQLKRAPGPRS